MSSTGSPVVAAFQNSSSVSTESTASPSTHFFRQSRPLSLGRSPPHAPTHNANGPDGGLRQLQSPPRLKCLPKGRPSSRFGPWFFDIDGSGATGGSMIRHAPEAALFPVDPLPVPVIEPALPALLVPPVGGPPLLPPRFPPAALAAVSVAPVTMTADPKHHTTAGPPAKPLTQCLFAGPHRRPSGGTGQPRLGMGGSISSTENVRSFLRVGAKTRSAANGRGFPFPPSAPPYQSLGQASARMTAQSLTIGAHPKSAVLKLILPCLLFPSASLNAPPFCLPRMGE